MLVYKNNKDDNSQLIQFTKDVEYLRNFKTTNFKKNDIYSLEYLLKYENISEVILKITSSFKNNIEYIDEIPKVEKVIESEVKVETQDNIQDDDLQVDTETQEDDTQEIKGNKKKKGNKNAK